MIRHDITVTEATENSSIHPIQQGVPASKISLRGHEMINGIQTAKI